MNNPLRTTLITLLLLTVATFTLGKINQAASASPLSSDAIVESAPPIANLPVSQSPGACNFNGICEIREHSGVCPSDCPRPGTVADTYSVCAEADLDTTADPDYVITVDAGASLGFYSRFWDCLGSADFNSNLLPSDEDLCSGEVCEYLGLTSPCQCNRDHTSLVNAAVMDMYASTQPRGRPAWSTFRTNFMLCDTVDDGKEPINKATRFRGARIYSENESGEPSYNWSVYDAGLDRLLNRYGMVPILSMDYMPDALAARPDSRTSWGNCSKSPPKDYGKWGDFIQAIVRHTVDRYGNQALDWPMEIWNEPDLPNLFWVCDPNHACCKDPFGWNNVCEVNGKNSAPDGDVPAYGELYRYAADGIRTVDNTIPIGGPTIAGDIGDFLKPFLQDYVGNSSGGVPTENFNFLSAHSYGATSDKQLGKMIGVMVPLMQEEPGLFDQRSDNFGYLITESGPTAATGSDWQNTRFVATWAVRQVDAFLGLRNHNVCQSGDRKGLYCETRDDCPLNDKTAPCLQGEPFLPEKTCFWTKPVPENKGLAETHFGPVVSTNDNPDNIVKRSSFNAYHALGFLSDEQISLSGTEYGDPVHGIATRNGQDSIEVILYNAIDGDSWSTQTTPAVVELSFTDLPFSTFKVSQFVIDANCSNAYDEFLAGKSIAEQQARDDLELAKPQFIASATGGSWSTRMRMDGNSVVLIVLERTGPSPTFTDVPFDHWAHDYIERLYQDGYIAGCSTAPMKYCPEQTMTRAESAVFVERGVHGAAFFPAQPVDQVFSDVPLWEWFAKWSDALWQDGYTAGCGTNPLIYCPLQGHTRAEGSVFFLRMMHGIGFVPPTPTGIFADVPIDAWYADWVEAAYLAGLIPACEATPTLRFCPGDPLDRAMAAYMMVQAKGLSIP